MIRLALLVGAAGLAGLFIQATLIHSAFPAAVAPDLLLVLVVLLALHQRSVGNVILSFFLGVLADFASGQFIGLNAAGMVVAFALVGLISSRVYAERSFAIALITFLCSLVKSLVCLLMLFVYAGAETVASNLWQVVLFEAILSAVSAPLFLVLLQWSGRRGASRAGKRAKGSFHWASETR